MSNKMISFHPQSRPSYASKIHPPVANKCRRFSTVSCKLSHTYGGILPLLALCSMLLFLLLSLLLLTFTGNRLHQEVLTYTLAPKRLQSHVIENWWGVLYPPPTLSGGIVPEENTKNQSADSVSDTLIFDNPMNWMSQKKHIFFDISKKNTALISSKTATHTVSPDSSLPSKTPVSSDNSITLRVTCRFLSFLPGGSE